MLITFSVFDLIEVEQAAKENTAAGGENKQSLETWTTSRNMVLLHALECTFLQQPIPSCTNITFCTDSKYYFLYASTAFSVLLQ